MSKEYSPKIESQGEKYLGIIPKGSAKWFIIGAASLALILATL